MSKPQPSSKISKHVEGTFSHYIQSHHLSSTCLCQCSEVVVRRKFILKLAKALLKFGAPSHRIESQLTAASQILDAQANFVHIPNIIIVTLGNGETKSMETHFVRAGGKIALSNLHNVHLIYRDVLHDKMGAEAGTEALDKILKAPPIYPLAARCGLAFICSSIMCVLAFGGSVLDMGISGACACVLQYLGLNVASKSAMYANVYEISVTIIVSFVARLLSTVPGNVFCYSAMSSAGVILVLPGFTILTSALELTSRNILCGSVRMVYAIIYTLFLGFGLTIGSDIYLVINAHARHVFEDGGLAKLTQYHGQFTATNGSLPNLSIGATFGIASASELQNVVKGCYREPEWPWWRQPLPWWTMFFLVPLYTTCSSLSNLQSFRSRHLPVMVLFACCSYAANKAASIYLKDRGDIVSAAGALVIGILGNTYSRVVRGTAFTSMVTGVLFLVPSGIAQGGGLTQTYSTSAAQYSNGFALALRMIQVAIGVTIGLFVSQIAVYAMGRRKNAAHFGF
ncbi:hypothetical protein PLICRDRAFT_102260 [Plicaturopsis crispa FD-325 SS-3]|nr:hypothetical protein PLICRDRAFT_102260 [Plicaturopsis crispa FD-325 SS-3]